MILIWTLILGNALSFITRQTVFSVINILEQLLIQSLVWKQSVTLCVGSSSAHAREASLVSTLIKPRWFDFIFLRLIDLFLWCLDIYLKNSLSQSADWWSTASLHSTRLQRLAGLIFLDDSRAAQRVSVSSFWRFLLPKCKTTSFKNSSSRYSDGHIIVLYVLLLSVMAVLRVFTCGWMTHDCRTNLPTGTDKVTWQIQWDQEGRSRRIIWFKVLKTYELDEPYSFRFDSRQVES